VLDVLTETRDKVRAAAVAHLKAKVPRLPPPPGARWRARR